MSQFNTELYKACKCAKNGGSFNVYGFQIELLSDFENDKCRAIVGMSDQVYTITLDHKYETAIIKVAE